MRYDIIGDIHGQFDKMTALLFKLGYRKTHGAFRHPEGRKAIFVGDLVDRGPMQEEVLMNVRRMIDGGSGLAVMGNHEWNAIGFGTLRPNSTMHYRERNHNKRVHHVEFLEQFGEDSQLHKDWLEWIATLPVTLELPGIRVCHAWWAPESIEMIKKNTHSTGALKEDFLWASFDKSSPEFKAMEDVTKGEEIDLPDGYQYPDHEGTPRTTTRVRWWDPSARSYRQSAMVPTKSIASLPDVHIPENVAIGYQGDVPLFVGHYWLSGTPHVVTPKVGVLDFGAAASGRPLVAYRWDGEDTLSNDKLVWVG